MLLSLGAEEEQRHGAGAGVRADDGIDIVDQHIFDVQTLAALIRDVFRVLDAVAVGDIDGLIFRRKRRLFHVIDQRIQ